VGTFWISGSLTGRATLYDQYLVRLEGAVISTSNVELATKFYSEVLDLPSIRQGVSSEVVGFQLPGDRRLFLRHTKRKALNIGDDDGVIAIRVRNGFEKLHRQIVSRSAAPAVALSKDNYLDAISILPGGRVSEILELEGGAEFLVKDFDGNKLVYFEPKKFVGDRYSPFLVKVPG